jgi:hypothetical protein
VVFASKAAPRVSKSGRRVAARSHFDVHCRAAFRRTRARVETIARLHTTRTVKLSVRSLESVRNLKHTHHVHVSMHGRASSSHYSNIEIIKVGSDT